jgi:hypothetical protein
VSTPSVTGSMTQQASGLSLGSGIRGGAGVIYKSLVSRSASRAGAEKALELRLLPLLPFIITASALLYHKGAESVRGTPSQHSIGRMMLESGLGYWVVENTKGVYPLWGAALSAYRAGQKPNALEKLKAVVSTATTLGMGYLGVHLFAGLSEGALQIEDREIAYYLNKPEFKTWSQKLLQEPPESAAHELGKSLEALRAKLAEQESLFAKGARPDWKMMKPMKADVANLKSELFARMQQADESVFAHAGQDFKKLFAGFRGTMITSQEAYVKLTRAMNPLFGYIIVGLMGGAVAARYLNTKLEERFPDLKKMKFRDLFSDNVTLMPQTSHNVYRPSAYSANPPILPGPYMVWPGASREIMQ